MGVVSFSTFPKTVCTVLIVWSWYAVFFKAIPIASWPLWVKTAVSLSVSFEFLCVLVLYWLIIVDGPHFAVEVPELQVLDEHQPPSVLVERSVMVKSAGGYRLCSKCNVWKPDRCHHCSSCGKCVLKMDHHCPWFGECIGYGNIRWFMQFLLHSCVYLLELTFACGIVEYQRMLNCSLHVLFAAILGLIFFFCILVLYGITFWQVIQGRTTIESYESQRFRHSGYRNVFDMGRADNWRIVMGSGWLQWLFPVKGPYDPGKGLWFQTADGNLIERLSSELVRQ